MPPAQEHTHDYGLLNSITEPVKYPLPNMPNNKDTSIFLYRKTSNQISVHQNHVEKTVFSTPFSLSIRAHWLENRRFIITIENL